MEQKKEHKSKNMKQKKQPGLLKEIGSLFAKIAVMAVLVVLLFTFLFGVFRSNDESMSPAIKSGDLVFFYRLNKLYVASDTLVMKHKGEKQVRRVLAVAGDTVNITEEDGLVINEEPQMEVGIYEETTQFVGDVEFPLTVPKGEVFVLGDAREHATDSRIYGCVPVKDTLGKVISVVKRRGI